MDIVKMRSLSKPTEPFLNKGLNVKNTSLVSIYGMGSRYIDNEVIIDYDDKMLIVGCL